MYWIIQHLQPFINSIGLLFDIFGAVCVSIEVVNQFHGKQFCSSPSVPAESFGGIVMVSMPPQPTPEFKKWELRKYLWMKIGLASLIVGFLFQIASNWVPFVKAIPETQSCVTASQATKE